MRKIRQPYGAALESSPEYRLPAMAMLSEGNQTSDRVALPMQQRAIGKRRGGMLMATIFLVMATASGFRSDERKPLPLRAFENRAQAASVPEFTTSGKL